MGSMADKIIEKNKQRQAALAGKTATVTPAKAPVKIGTAEEAKKEVEKKALHKCGHEIPIKSLMNQDCSSCGYKKRQEKRQKKSDAKREATALINTRLPNGSKWEIEPYDALRVTWTGKLIIPQGEGKDNLVFEGKFGAVFGLLKMLDHQYRVWLEQQKIKENSVAKTEGT